MFTRLAALFGFVLLLSSSAAAELGISGTQFTINGKPAFLLGISYYAALGAPREFVQRDLSDMQRDGFNWIRVWANWGGFHTNISAFESDGTAREPFFQRLEDLVSECDRRGMIVDITLARENGAKIPPGLPGLTEHRQAVETLLKRLSHYRNWYLDLANERNIRDKRFVPIDQLKILRDRAKALDPKRLITASQSCGDDELIESFADDVNVIRLDFIAQHRSRAKGTATQTEEVTRRYLSALKALGKEIPLLYQEPFRRGYMDWNPSADDFFNDLRGAIRGGAAGWCFHNGSQRASTGEFPRRSFDLREKRLYEQLDDVELTVRRGVKNIVSGEKRKTGEQGRVNK
jgi:hypothetical protein